MGKILAKIEIFPKQKKSSFLKFLSLMRGAEKPRGITSMGGRRAVAIGAKIRGRLRAAGLDAVGKIPLLKRQFARRALGLSGDVPVFLKGDRAWPHR